MNARQRIDETGEALKHSGTPFVLATVVRTVAATAAKAGAKAIILEDGSIAAGWIGGGCARGAVLKAANEAFIDRKPRLISVQPEDLLSELGVAPGELRDGVRFARNMCPSHGTMDIFIEPVLPMPSLFVLGASPVATALADVSRRFGFRSIACAPPQDQPAFVDVDDRIEGFLLPASMESESYIVVATQGRGDEAALSAAACASSDYVAFVGSRAKASSLRARLDEKGFARDALDRIKAPAGLDIGAVTPEEIALSIIAEIIQLRRRQQRAAGSRQAAAPHDPPVRAPDKKAEDKSLQPGMDGAGSLHDRSTTRRLGTFWRALFRPVRGEAASSDARVVPIEDILMKVHSCCM